MSLIDAPAHFLKRIHIQIEMRMRICGTPIAIPRRVRRETRRVSEVSRTAIRDHHCRGSYGTVERIAITAIGTLPVTSGGSTEGKQHGIVCGNARLGERVDVAIGNTARSCVSAVSVFARIG